MGSVLGRFSRQWGPHRTPWRSPPRSLPLPRCVQCDLDNSRSGRFMDFGGHSGGLPIVPQPPTAGAGRPVRAFPSRSGPDTRDEGPWAQPSAERTRLAGTPGSRSPRPGEVRAPGGQRSQGVGPAVPGHCRSPLVSSPRPVVRSPAHAFWSHLQNKSLVLQCSSQDLLFGEPSPREVCVPGGSIVREEWALVLWNLDVEK